MKKSKSIYIDEHTVIDPETGNKIHLEIYKDIESGGVFGIDSSYIEQVSQQIISPFNPDTILLLEGD